MWKKILIGFFLCTSILAFSTVSNASGGTTANPEIKSGVNIDKSKYEVLNPEKRAYTSKDRVTFVNGKAPSGTRISIKVYGTTDLTRKNFDLHTLPKAEDYIESYTDEVISGNMGFFDKQIDLVSGINKIILNFNVEGVPNVEIIVFVQSSMTKNAEQIRLSDILNMTR